MAASSAVPDTEAAKALVAELCACFYRLGWVSGTGGGVSIKTSAGTIVMAPSGVQKERMQAADMFVLSAGGAVLSPPASGLKLSECAPLFLAAYELRGTGAVLHSHGLEALLVTLLDERRGEAGAWRASCISRICWPGPVAHAC